ncbi:DUF4153 domain-containing protein [Flavobacterium sp. FZUC8N2.13]|uniref:DUF4153 domain-containing protein n=1 Tax=Flavobacterium zubiriense TaxID=3138075 RepID=A0ABV4TA30_9FLAO
MASFPSFQKIIQETQRTFLRFPLEILITITGTICAIYVTNETNRDTEELFTKIIMGCSLCLVLFLSITLYSLNDKKNSYIRFISSFISGALIFVFIFQFSERIKEFETYQFLSLNLALHLLVSFAAFINKKYDEGTFWEFNKQLFLRILTSTLYSIVIYAGLSFALLATHHLFNVDYYNEIYLDLFFVIFGIFNTVFFLSGIPETNNINVPLHLNYPIALKKFTQFVLIPLISIYFLILLSYEIKIIALFSLPVGWVSNLILVFAIFGILSLLLIHPIANDKGNVWMRTFHKWFYYLLVPLIGLLFWAILYRINLYGFTHERYYVLVLSIWLTILTVYFIFKKEPQIKFIPISMCLIAMLTILGPQSADSVSKRSQLNRFQDYITRQKSTLTIEEEKDLSSIVSFINKNYGIKELIPFSNKLALLTKKDKVPGDSQIMEALGYSYRGRYYNENDKKENFYYSHYNPDRMNIEKIQGYDLAFEISDNNNSNCENCLDVNGKKYSINYSKKDYGIELKINNDTIPLQINNFILQNKALLNDNHKKLTQTVTTKNYEIQLNYQSLDGENKDDKIILNWFSINVLLKMK